MIAAGVCIPAPLIMSGRGTSRVSKKHRRNNGGLPSTAGGGKKTGGKESTILQPNSSAESTHVSKSHFVFNRGRGIRSCPYIAGRIESRHLDARDTFYAGLGGTHVRNISALNGPYSSTILSVTSSLPLNFPGIARCKRAARLLVKGIGRCLLAADFAAIYRFHVPELRRFYGARYLADETTFR